MSDSDNSDVDIDNEYDPKTHKRNKGKGKVNEKGGNDGYTWEETYVRTWDAVQEDEGGSLQSAVEDLLAQRRRRRLLTPAGAVRRTIIRHLVILIDLSLSMLDRDMRPTRFELSLQYAREFVTEWFDQNPLGQIGIVGMRNGVGERICGMTGNPQDVLKTISDKHKLQPDGEPSLQNAIEMARGSMAHLPSHSSREILVLYGSLTTCDPGNIHETIDGCVKDKIRINVVALAAEMKVCRDMCNKTGGSFGVALNEGHYRDLVFETIPPPEQRATKPVGPGQSVAASVASDLLIMGFPTRLPDSAAPSLCACHAELKKHGFLCPRCNAKLCDVPTDCDLCGLMIVSSPHLARSYHHLFPVKAYVAQASAELNAPSTCYACSMAFPVIRGAEATAEGVSPIGRYRCPDCKHDYCADCDEFVHTVLHVCPGCSS